MRYKVKPAMFLSMRNDLLTSLQAVDADIEVVLDARKTEKTLDRARELFSERERICCELADFGIDVEAHPAVWSRHA